MFVDIFIFLEFDALLCVHRIFLQGCMIKFHAYNSFFNVTTLKNNCKCICCKFSVTGYGFAVNVSKSFTYTEP